VTLKQVAAAVGCSLSVVSAVLNKARNNTRVGPELAARIQAAAKKLAYRSNYHARVLRTGRAHLIGVVDDRMDPVSLHRGIWGKILGGIGVETRRHDSDVMLISHGDGERDALTRAIALLEQRQIDALLVNCLIYSDRHSEVDRARGRVVWYPMAQPGRHPSAAINHEPGIREAVAHLASLGHREILWFGHRIGGEPVLPNRKDFFDLAVKENRVESRVLWADSPAHMKGTAEFRDSFRAVFSRHLNAGKIPTAVIVYNEMAALGVYEALAGRGLRVPQDVSVIGYDNVIADLATPPMTVVSLELPEVGRLAARLALDPDNPAKKLVCPTKLVVRQSTGPVRRKIKPIRKALNF